MRGRVFLGGGGSELDEARLWAEAFPPGSTVAVWPFAQRTLDGRRASVEWMTTALAARGRFSVDAWLSPDRTETSLSGVDVVAVPGGNTFDLVHALRAAGLLEVLHEHLRRGGDYYGGSAGAILAGQDVGIAATADPNDVGLRDTFGMGLLWGADVLPHYTAGQQALATEHARRTGRPVLCLPESCGVVVGADGVARNAGPDTAYVVDASTVDLVAAGETRTMRTDPEAWPP